MVIAGIRGKQVNAQQFTPESKIILTDTNPATYVLEAYCAEFHKDNPSPSVSFSLDTSDAPLASILTEGKKQNLSVQALQAAVWISSDKVTYEQMNARFPINESDWKEGKTIVDMCNNEKYLLRTQNNLSMGLTHIQGKNNAWANAILSLPTEWWDMESKVAMAAGKLAYGEYDMDNHSIGISVPEGHKIDEIMQIAGPPDRKEQDELGIGNKVINFYWSDIWFSVKPNKNLIVGVGMPIKMWKIGPVKIAKDALSSISKPTDVQTFSISNLEIKNKKLRLLLHRNKDTILPPGDKIYIVAVFSDTVDINLDFIKVGGSFILGTDDLLEGPVTYTTVVNKEDQKYRGAFWVGQPSDQKSWLSRGNLGITLLESPNFGAAYQYGLIIGSGYLKVAIIHIGDFDKKENIYLLSNVLSTTIEKESK